MLDYIGSRGMFCSVALLKPLNESERKAIQNKRVAAIKAKHSIARSAMKSMKTKMMRKERKRSFLCSFEHGVIINMIGTRVSRVVVNVLWSIFSHIGIVFDIVLFLFA
jgi:uncharacterized protein YbbC (DUF1343 family)